MTQSEDYVERATEMNPSEAPLDKQQKYRRLKTHHDQRGSGRDSDNSKMRERAGADVVMAVASQLELTDFQKSRARNFYAELDSEFRSGRPIELIAISICALVGWFDGRDYHPNHFHPNSDVDNRLSEILANSQFGYKRFYRCWSQLTKELGV